MKEREEYRAWSSDTELLAGILELLDAINQRIQSGLGVKLLKRIPGQVKTKPVPRPPWMKKQAEKPMSPRDFFAKMMSGR